MTEAHALEAINGPFGELASGSVELRHVADIQLGKMLQNEATSPEDMHVPYLKAKHVQASRVVAYDLPKMWASQDELAQYAVVPGDLLVLEGGDVGRSAIAVTLPQPCIIQNAVHRVRSRASDIRYIDYCLQVIHGSGWLDVICNKATIAHLTSEKLKALLVPVMAQEEQRAIADYLDAETARIDALIAAKESLLAILAEKRKALVTQAVTRGLDPGVPMRDSGIPWLGEIPAHWEVVPLRWFARIGSGDFIASSDVVPLPDETREVPVVGGNGVAGYTEQANSNDNAIVIGRVGALCGNVHLVDEPAWITDNALRLRNIRSFSANYLRLTLIEANLNTMASRTAQPLITGSQVLALRLSLPPLDEQHAIVTHVALQAQRLDDMAEANRNTIKLLKERREAVIAAAVTGKLELGAS